MEALVAVATGIFILLGVALGVALRSKSKPPVEKKDSAYTKPKPEPYVIEVPAPPPPEPTRAEERQRLLADAARARKEGDLQEALRLYREAQRIERTTELTRLIQETEGQLRDKGRERSEYERLERTLTALPDEAAVQACDEFLRKFATSSYAERALILKQDLMKRIQANATVPKPEAKPEPKPEPLPLPKPPDLPPPPPSEAWLFILKSGGQLRAISYEEIGEKYSLRLASGKMAIRKEDVAKIQKLGGQEKR